MGARTTIRTKQRTLTVNGEKIIIKSRNRGYVGNHVGFNVFINGDKFFKNYLKREEAEEAAYSDWVRKHK